MRFENSYVYPSGLVTALVLGRKDRILQALLESRIYRAHRARADKDGALVEPGNDKLLRRRCVEELQEDNRLLVGRNQHAAGRTGGHRTVLSKELSVGPCGMFALRCSTEELA